MKIFWLLFGCGSSLSLFAQDTIYTVAEFSIPAQVLEIHPETVQYVDWGNEQRETLELAKNQIVKIRFADGMEQYFQLSQARDSLGNFLYQSNENLSDYQQGAQEARLYYDHRASMWGTFGATVIYPIGGVFTGAATGLVIGALPSEPKIQHLPDPERFETDSEYARGYRREMNKKKAKRIVTGYGLGMAVQTAMVVVIVWLINL
jgi:hypothetical protein